MFEVLLVLMACSMACGILGPFIVLRKLSMITDALSHSVLLGIAVAFIFVKDLNSILLLVGAAFFGVLTVVFSEFLSNHKLVKKDDALGLVFPLFFSIAIIIITKYFKNVHLDIDMVLMGNPLFAPFMRIFNLPKSLVIMLLLFLINVSFVLIFYKILKVSTFDEEFSKIQGINYQLIFYILIILTSVTSVAAFDSVGAILVISFFISPSASAYLLTKDLKYTIILTLIIGVINAIIGTLIAYEYNISISGTISFISMINVVLAILFNKKGLIFKIIQKQKNKKQFSLDLILIHIYRHKEDPNELGISTIKNHLNWSKNKSDLFLIELLTKNMIYIDKKTSIYQLSELGKGRIKELLKL